jgi:hypothetical protein
MGKWQGIRLLKDDGFLYFFDPDKMKSLKCSPDLHGDRRRHAAEDEQPATVGLAARPPAFRK